MDGIFSIDLEQLSKEIDLPLEKVRATVALIDEGNTVPFITRYRKDQTGGLDEDHIRRIEQHVSKLRALAERKNTILKSIESQGKLTENLAEQIKSSRSPKRLEDLYLPYKPKKQTLASVARQRGLEPLANEVLQADKLAAELAVRAMDFVSSDKGLNSLEDVLQGVGHLLAERFSERADLRGRLRKILWRSGKLVCSTVEPISKTSPNEPAVVNPKPEKDVVATSPESESSPPQASSQDVIQSDTDSPPSDESTPTATPTLDDSQTDPITQVVAQQPATEIIETQPSSNEQTTEPEASQTDAVTVENTATEEAKPADVAPQTKPQPTPAAAKKSKKQIQKEKLQKAFQDYVNYQEPLTRIPPHRILAINRGERAKVLRVKIEADETEFYKQASELLVPTDHPHAVLLGDCVRDALTRLVIPAIQREIRRELLEKAENHAIEVFAQNLRKLLLQPPVHGRRALAIDPGYRSGCKLAALDEFGNPLAHDVIHVVGAEQRRRKGREKLVEMIRQHNVNVIAVGNGAACRQTEQLVAEIIADELKDSDVSYVIVNEAGASVYSTSALGSEEMPDCDATQRGTVSIGRRLLDPLSELVKINAANIGVGMYQHDVKSKHLDNSLNDVVESCVNFVGVDVNSASPSLLRYVSGLNQLTARRLYEHRCEHGPFRNREQLKEVAGFGEAAFIQAAGFLKIIGGDNPLDATWIHPESYKFALLVLEKLGCDVDSLAIKSAPLPAILPGEKEPDPAPKILKDSSAEATADPDVQSSTSTETPETIPIGVIATNGAASKLAQQAAAADPAQLAIELNVGKRLLQDILTSLIRPGRDPRSDFPPPVFRRGILKIEDLEPGMELSGSVLNVVDFGAFVDIGLSDSGLVHISRLSDQFVSDPHEVVSVGDILKVWVVEIDKQRRRVSLTAIEPGTEKPRRPRREKRSDSPPGRRRNPAAKKGKPATHVKGQRGGKRVGPPKFQTSPRRKPKPKPVKPITEAMAEGTEPMRSFSDLVQFFEKKDDEDSAGSKSKK